VHLFIFVGVKTPEHDSNLIGEQREVVGQLVVAGDDGAVAGSVELRTSGAAENLKIGIYLLIHV
jgi:hypothetical protein